MVQPISRMSDVQAIRPQATLAVRVPPFAPARPIAAENMPKPGEPQSIETTAVDVAAELACRGVTPTQRVTVAIAPDGPDDRVAKARLFARPKVIAEGWSDEDIDRLIEEERDAVQSRLIPGREMSDSPGSCWAWHCHRANCSW